MKRTFVALLAALLVYEVVALVNSSPDDTISELVWAMSRRPLVPFLAGFVMGHLFWQRKEGTQ